MAYQHKDNTGSLWENSFKNKDNDPDYRGSGMVNGRERSIAGWKRTTKDGRSYISISFTEPRPKTQNPTAPTKANPSQASPEDDVPF
jgi:uncharacterized protein (DUF736 family)